jgi:hypothetical protein
VLSIVDVWEGRETERELRTKRRLPTSCLRNLFKVQRAYTSSVADEVSSLVL